VSWIIFSNQSSKPSERLCANGKTKAAPNARLRHRLGNIWNSSVAALGLVGLILPLIVVGSTQANAFPNVGINLQKAIQKQEDVLHKQKPAEGFKFGIMGSFEFKTVNHRFQSDWQDVLTRIKSEQGDYETCSFNANCNPKVRQWRALLEDLKGLPADVQLAHLNKSINRMARYADDTKTFGKKDHWATPLEFLKGKADCEDYATVKFWSLLELGFSNEQLRLAIVRDQRRGIMHAVVTVDMGAKKLVLDSLFDHVVEERYILKYAPIYSANLDSQFAHIVSRQLRVTYLNQLEDQVNGRVLKAAVKSKPRKALPATTMPVAPMASMQSSFVDWT